MVQTEQFKWAADDNGVPVPTLQDANLVLVFGAVEQLNQDAYQQLRNAYPQAILFGCSTAGEILGTRVYDDTVTATAVRFEHTTLTLSRQTVAEAVDSRAVGSRLVAGLPADGLRHVLVLSDGLNVNGSELVAGIRGELPDSVEVTGGLSGDADRFQRTLVMADSPPDQGIVAAVGFYGDRLRVGYGSVGGWDPFGPDRLITRSAGNVLYELDGQSALALYKKYLGEHAEGLPATGLLFPLALRAPGEDDIGLVRTILSVDEQNQSMTFAGDMPEGMYARLMKANFERLVDGAYNAAEAAHGTLHGGDAQLGILISCVGRKLVLQQRVEEEVEAVSDILGDEAVLTGFYSYGEISPYAHTGRCELHNQTMTITTFRED